MLLLKNAQSSRTIKQYLKYHPVMLFLRVISYNYDKEVDFCRFNLAAMIADPKMQTPSSLI